MESHGVRFLNDKHARMHAHMHVAMLALMHIVWRLTDNYEISNYFFWLVHTRKNKLVTHNKYKNQVYAHATHERILAYIKTGMTICYLSRNRASCDSILIYKVEYIFLSCISFHPITMSIVSILCICNLII